MSRMQLCRPVEARHAVEAPGRGSDAPALIAARLRHPSGAESQGATGPHLYDGAAGVAFFLAAFHHVSGDADARTSALRLVAPLRAKLAQLAADPARSGALALPVGGLVGLGSFVYTFVRLAAWLREPALLVTAAEAASLLTPERIAGDDRLDVVSGSAGSILALLALHQAAPGEGAPLEAARRCGRHLLDRRTSSAGLPRAWPGSGARPLSGFAHGAAGISLALLRLQRVAGGDELGDAAREGFAYERALYDRAARNWMDPRFGRLVEQSAWCHGAPGIALARIAALEFADGPEIRDDLGEALSITRELPVSPADHLCCGNLGRADILWTAGEVLASGELRAEAERLAEHVETRAREGDFACEGTSLFRGLAGVGYALLRTENPGQLPSLLLLES
jgi:lantibiotic modifying enzyme